MKQKSIFQKKTSDYVDSSHHSLPKEEINDPPNFDIIIGDYPYFSLPNPQPKDNPTPKENLIPNIMPLDEDENLLNGTSAKDFKLEQREGNNKNIKQKSFKSKKKESSTPKDIADSRNRKLLNLKRKRTDENKSNNDSSDNSMKKVFRNFLPVIRELIESLGNISLNDVNHIIGGIEQNQKILEAKVYQLFCYNEENLTEYLNANPGNEVLFNYFSTRTLKFLFLKYFYDSHHFIIEGQKYENIEEFKTLKDLLKENKIKFYNKIDGESISEKLEKFIKTNFLVLNDFEGCDKRKRNEIKDVSALKLNKFEKYIETKNYNNKDTLSEERNNFSFFMNKPYDLLFSKYIKGELNYFPFNMDISTINYYFKLKKMIEQKEKKQKILNLIDENIISIKDKSLKLAEDMEKSTKEISNNEELEIEEEVEEDEIKFNEKNTWEFSELDECCSGNYLPDLQSNNEAVSLCPSPIREYSNSSYDDFINSKIR